MDLLTTILILMLAVAASGVLIRLVAVPPPLLQIAAGATLSLAFGLTVTIDPPFFLCLFVAPLLFVDAFRFPQSEFRHLAGPIVMLALGLVVATVVGAGYVIHELLPVMPLAVCFALAAVLAPTDAVALAGSTGGVRMPSRLQHILEGEALFNDASGLVCLRFAVAAALTGRFSPADALVRFVAVAGGAVAVGTAVGWLAGRIRPWLTDRAGDHPPTQVLIFLLLPFAAYLAAESLEVSGILAAVTAGVTLNLMPVHAGMVATRLQGRAVLGILQFTLNGMIFVLLGLQLPAILGAAPAVAREAGLGSPLALGLDALAIAAALLVLRLGWTLVSLKLTLYRRPRGRRKSVPFRLILAGSFGGVRGAITLAAVLSLPLYLPDGQPFPGRELAIFLAAWVILISLVAAAIALPLLLKGLPQPAETKAAEEERLARLATAEAAMRRVEALQKDLAADADDADLVLEVAVRVLEEYRQRLDTAGASEERRRHAKRLGRTENRLRQEAIRAEREELLRLAQDAAALNSASAARLLRALDFAEASLVAGHPG